MIKTVDKSSALKYAKGLNLSPYEYAIFDLGKETLIVGGSKDAFPVVAREAAENFAVNFAKTIYDAFPNDDEKRLMDKVKLSDAFVQVMTNEIIKMLQEEKIFFVAAK